MPGNLPEGLFDRVNYVTDLWQDPCRAPWEVYVETAFPHALELIVAATTFGGFTAASQLTGFMEEVVEGVADPGGYNLFRRGLRGSRRGRFRNPLMDLPDKVARRAYGYRAVQALTDNAAGKSFFTVYNLAERANLAWFLANKAEEEFVEWTTSLYQTQKCSQASRPRAGADFGGGAVIPLSGFQPLYLGPPDYLENGAYWTNGQPGLGDVPGRFIASNTLRNDDGPFKQWLQVRSTYRGVIAEEETECPQGSDCTLMVSCDMRPNERPQALVLHERLDTQPVSGFIRASGANAAQGRQITGEPF